MIDFLSIFLFSISGLLAIGISLVEAKKIRIENSKRTVAQKADDKSKESVADIAVEAEKEAAIETPELSHIIFPTVFPKGLPCYTVENFWLKREITHSFIEHQANHLSLLQLRIIMKPPRYKWFNKFEDEMQSFTLNQVLEHAYEFGSSEDWLDPIILIEPSGITFDGLLSRGIPDKHWMRTITDVSPIYNELPFSILNRKVIQSDPRQWLKVTVPGIFPDQSHTVLIHLPSDSKTEQDLPEYYLKITEEEFNNLTKRTTRALSPPST